MRKTMYLVALAGVLVFAACDNDPAPASLVPVTSEDVPAQSSENVKSVLEEASEALSFFDESSFGESVGSTLGGGDDEATSGDCWTWDEEAQMEVPCSDDPGSMEDEAAGFAEFLGDAAEALDEFLTEEVFIDGEESADGKKVTYNLTADQVCDLFEGDGDEPQSMPGDGLGFVPVDDGEGGAPFEEEEEQDPPMDEEAEDEGPSCEEIFTEVPLSLEVTSPGEKKLDIQLLVGSAKLNPVTLYLYPGKLGIEVDLGDLLGAAELVAAAAGEDFPELPETVDGAVGAFLTKDADKVFTLSVAVTEAITIAGSMEEEDYSLSVGVSNPLAALTFDANTETITATVGLGPVDVSVPASWLEMDGCDSGSGGAMSGPPMPAPEREGGKPGDADESEDEEWMPDGGSMDGEGDDYWEDDCEETEPLTGTLEAHLGGLTASMAFDGEDESLEVTGVGLGKTTTTLSRNGNELFAVDLNADHGREFNAEVTFGEDDGSLKVSPALVVEAAFNLSKSQGWITDAPAFLDNETFKVSLDGAAAPELRFPDIMGGSSSTQVGKAPTPIPTDDGDDEKDGENTGDPGMSEPVWDDNEDDGPGFQIEVVAGKLTLSSSSLASDVVVDAGMCLVDVPDVDGDEGEDDDDDEKHPFSYVEAGACEERVRSHRETGARRETAVPFFFGRPVSDQRSPKAQRRADSPSVTSLWFLAPTSPVPVPVTVPTPRITAGRRPWRRLSSGVGSGRWRT